jgi:hypothetical protein
VGQDNVIEEKGNEPLKQKVKQLEKDNKYSGQQTVV